MHLDADHIDQSAWLNPRDSIVTPERLAKGDLLIEDVQKNPTADVSKVYFAQAQVNTILNWLYEIDAITGRQAEAGYSYHVWRDYFAAQWSGRQSSAMFYEARGEVEGSGVTAHLFTLLLRRIGPRDKKLLDFAVDVIANGHTKSLIRPETFCGPFERLVMLVQDVREQAKAEAERIEAIKNQD